MAQGIVSWFVDGGRFRVLAINAIGRRRGRVIEVEVIETGERFHGSARRMERLVRALHAPGSDLDATSAWQAIRPSGVPSRSRKLD
jgi:hypothetical protein